MRLTAGQGTSTFSFWQAASEGYPDFFFLHARRAILGCPRGPRPLLDFFNVRRLPGSAPLQFAQTKGMSAYDLLRAFG
jgi:hypothetical protein